MKPTNEVREGIEKDVDDLAAHFEGGICGEDENGNGIVGFGVSGSANIFVTPFRVSPTYTFWYVVFDRRFW